MSLLTANGISVVAGSISMPLVGVWTADLVLDNPDGTGFDAGASVSISTFDNSFTLSGVVAPLRTGSFLDATHVRVLGGKGGMAKPATPRSFVQPGAYVRDVLNALATASGESLSSSIAPSFLSSNLTAWTIMKAQVSTALETLLEYISPAYNWRILADGTLWVGAESWQSSSVAYDVLEIDPELGTYMLGVESPALVPGVVTADGWQVWRVEHEIGESKIRSRIYTAGAADRGIKGAIGSMIGQYIAGIDYYAFYDAKVISQSADGSTVDLRPADPRLPGMGSVPIKLGIPGAVAKFAAGAVVRLGWDRGDPSRPFACLFDGGATLTTLEIGSGSTQFVALSNKVQNYLTALSTAINGWNPVANDGGAALKTALSAAGIIGGTWGADVASLRLKAT